jgi:hypothetical protein
MILHAVLVQQLVRREHVYPRVTAERGLVVHVESTVNELDLLASPSQQLHDRAEISAVSRKIAPAAVPMPVSSRP